MLDKSYTLRGLIGGIRSVGCGFLSGTCRRSFGCFFCGCLLNRIYFDDFVKSWLCGFCHLWGSVVEEIGGGLEEVLTG